MKRLWPLQRIQLIRTLLCLLVCVAGIGQAAGQSYVYTEKEMSFDVDKEQMRLMKMADGSFHVWHWGSSRITMDAYNSQLQHQYKKQISNRSSYILFIPFRSFYYALIIEPKKSRIYKVEADSLIDKTADFNRIPILETSGIYIQPGNNNFFLLQYNNTDTIRQSQIHIISIDSNLNYITTLALSTNYNGEDLRRLKVFSHNNQLMLVNTKVYDDYTKLILHKVDMDSNTVISNSFQFDDKLFRPFEVRPFGRNFLLQGQMSGPIFSARKQTSYTYLMTLDDSLKSISHYYTGLMDSSIAPNQLYMYYPVSTSILPNYHLLTIDYCKVINTKKSTYGTQLRYHQLDANLRNMNTITLPTMDYNNFPGYLFLKPGETNIYYEEQIRENITVVHSCQLSNTIENDRILQLRPKNRYMLRKAIPVADNYFVMPYTHNYKLGLVRVKVDTED